MTEPVSPEPTQPTRRGRRMAAPGTPGPQPVALVLAVAVPIVALVAALLVNGSPAAAPAPVAPAEAKLTSLQLTCPAAPTGRIGVATVEDDADGVVVVRQGGQHRDVRVVTDRVAWVGEPGPMVVDGRKTIAPGLLATRADDKHAAAVPCHLPRPDTWFTGAGAASIHSSTLQLVNPDAGLAIANVQLLGTQGLLDARRLNGVSVPGNSVVTIELSAQAPTRSELAIHVSVQRGRLGASLLDSHTERSSSADWIPPQFAPATVNTVVGTAAGPGERTLVVANPTDNQARVQVKVIGSTSTYAPQGFSELSVPPQSVVARSLSGVLGTAATKDAVGLLVTSSQPVTASVRSLVGAELSSAVAVPAITDAGLVLPDGKATLMVAAPDEAGSAQVAAYDAGGKRLLDQRIAAKKLTGARFALPKGTALVRISDVNGGLHAAVQVVSGKGVVTLPLEDAVVSGLIPDVRAAMSGSSGAEQ